MRQADPVTDRQDAFATLRTDLRQFRDERDWARFHDPKSLILALMGEVGELAELFQWVPTDEAIAQFSVADRKTRAAEEMSDVLIYLIGLADVLDIDLIPAAQAKLEESRRRFPVDDTHGVAPLKA
jgi:NTP pyrophosphatase (non-canonical NTP hydrolase)